MIKYLELTAPEKSEFRQAKILSIEVSEDDEVAVGDTLFKVKSGKKEIDLPSTMDGKVVEVIALVGENISILTPLVLLETEVATSTATPPINPDAEPSADKEPSASKKPLAKKEPLADKESSVSKEPSANKEQSKPKKSKAKKTKKKKQRKKEHQQQSLNLDPDAAQNQESDIEEDNSTNPTIEAESKTTPTPALAETTETNTMSNIQVTVPDIGADNAKVIEIFVAIGDQIEIDDPLVTLESDKASMDVPSTHAGTVTSISVSVDQDIAEGDLLIELSTSDESDSPQSDSQQQESAPAAASETQPAVASNQTIDIIIPDIGGDSAKVIEILVEVGQEIAAEDSLVTLESDKASMDVPSTVAGKIESIELEVDQDVSEGMLVVKILSTQSNAPAKATEQTNQQVDAPAPTSTPTTTEALAPVTGKAHASPSIRRFARELGVDLSKVGGSGRKGRIVKSDVKAFVKSIITGGTAAQSGAASGSGIPPIPTIDFTKFGEIDVQPLSKIKKLTAKNLHRSWLNVPHVTHNDESNISDLEDFRKQLNKEYAAKDKGIKLSPLAFIVKAAVHALRTYPQFNSSLEPGGENIIYKKYIHIGIAVETPNGLVVPVIRDADKKSISEIALAMGELAAKARDKKLSPADMSGASFTISSLGGIGGTSFTPIVNAPEVAILGVSRSKMQPVWNGKEFEPAMILPLSLSYDHRIIDGAEAARFTAHIAAALEDVRRLTV